MNRAERRKLLSKKKGGFYSKNKLHRNSHLGSRVSKKWIEQKEEKLKVKKVVNIMD